MTTLKFPRDSSSFKELTTIDAPDDDTISGVDVSTDENVRWPIALFRELVNQAVHVYMSADASGVGPGLVTLPIDTFAGTDFFPTPTLSIYSLSSNELKPLIPGIYSCSFGCHLRSGGGLAANDNIQAILEKNVDEVCRGTRRNQRGTSPNGSHGCIRVKMNGTTDVLKLRCNIDAAGARDVNGGNTASTYLNVMRLGT